jgi:hypothetical protein
LELNDLLMRQARSFRAGASGYVNLDGIDVAQWKRPDYQRTVPTLPVEFRATRADKRFASEKLFAYLIVTLLLGPIAMILVFRREVERGLFWLVYLVAIVVIGMGLQRWQRQVRERTRDETWCRLTEHGMEYQEPGTHYKLLWSEIDKVSNYQAIESEDSILELVQVEAGHRKFLISSYYFTEEEVKQVHAICSLRSGAPSRW